MGGVKINSKTVNSEPKVYDVIIVGAGSMGMSAGYHLAKRGVSVLMIDRLDPPHQEGSHHGEPRLIRHAYSGDPVYTEMALRAQQLWEEAELESGSELFVRSGVLNVTDRELFSYWERYTEARHRHIPVELLEAAEIRRRWPGFQIPDGFEALYEPEAGYLHSERCVAAYRKLAEAAGAELLTNTPVMHVTAEPGKVTIFTREGCYYGSTAILSAGAWFRSLTPFLSLPIRAVRKTVGWFEAGDSYQAGNFPGFTLNTNEGSYYGFPDIGGAGLKIGRHDTGSTWIPGETLQPFGTQEEDEGDLRRQLGRYLPDASGRLLRGAVCKYEHSPDENFIIDRHPLHPHVIAAGGFSGHGFKFASVIGEILADLVTGQSPAFDLKPFALSRFDRPTVKV